MIFGRSDNFAETADSSPAAWKISRTAWLVILLGFALRLYLFFRIPIINQDGFLYIQQAKALYYGLFDAVIDCYEYLPNYPFLIAAAYKIFGDWVTAARTVSLIFGTLTLIPLYLIYRRFFPAALSTVTLLAFALIPSFILVSSDVMRGPMYWFFSASGMFLFLFHMDEQSGGRAPASSFRIFALMTLSCLFFLMGTWARIECGMFIIISAVYLLFSGQKRKYFSLFSFLLPVLIIILGGFIFACVSRADILELLKPERIFSRAAEFFSKYSEIRKNLALLAEQELPGFTPFFFPKVRNLIWLIALGTLAVQIVETLFYIFFLILIIGIANAFRRIPAEPKLMYISLLSVSALLVLYAQIIYNWAMTSRFTFLFLLPAFVFSGYGIERISEYIQKKTDWKQPFTYILICVLMISAASAKTLRASYVKDKEVYEEIGTCIAEREKNSRSVDVAGAFDDIKKIHFYANLNYEGAPCFDEFCEMDKRNTAGLRKMRHFGCHYFVWDEKGWKSAMPEKLKDKTKFIYIREWQTSRHGKMILYEVRQ